MGASSDGFTVKSGMSGQAKELDGAGDDTGRIRKAIEPGLCYTDDALGGPDSAAAFNAYAAAWEAEAKTLQAALHELADKVRGSKGAYGGSDGLVDTSVRSVRVPAGDSHLTTMPAHADRPSALAGY
ncbi:uncharacterized protein YukE [Streptomyces griseochromogenes]|uniref:Uncharacterized protein YukE n=2 Tax=Streptomyces griseochromogenes TaxID=68214 RepID=A0A1B1BEC8_9ACTN|nr:hypothetical protein [Streptomyces griseochromogenes]ANP57171.1 hypothetical protein AVL59_44220 [Streptomyces griseochromogenes]MBP2052691.1 uncharacterized protein YukE [Streptomyces griseochromogenes]